MSLLSNLKKVIAPAKIEPQGETRQNSPPESTAAGENPPTGAQEEIPPLILTEEDHRRRHLLFLSDNPRLLPELEQLLAPLREDWHVVATASEAHALNITRNLEFDAVICDWHGSENNWVDFLRNVSEVRPNILRFMRAPGQESAWVAPFGHHPPLHLSTELDGQGLADLVGRSVVLHLWLANPEIKKLLEQMKRLPSLPNLYTQVLSELNKPDSSISFVGRLIAKDPALTAKLLQCVNSATFGLSRQITDPVEAVLYMGIERTKAVLLVSSMYLQFDKQACPGFSHDGWWRHSIAVGGLAQSITIAETRDVRLADLAFTAGLLHDTGKLLLAANQAPIYSRIIEQAQRRKVTHGEVERELFGATHAEIGACFLGTWRLPFAILAAIAWHHSPSQSSDSKFSVLTAVHAADAIENEKREDSLGLHQNRIDSEYMLRINLKSRPNAWRKRCDCLIKPDYDPFQQEEPTESQEAA